MRRRRYDDDFRAAAVLMLEAAGYPGREGALSHVAGHLSVPHSTLSRWFRSVQNPPPPNLVLKKRLNLVEELTDLLGLSIGAAKGAVNEAGYRELATGIGILVDKIQLLTGQPTWRGEIIDLLKSGAVTPADVESELGNDLARELFDAAGIDRIAS